MVEENKFFKIYLIISLVVSLFLILRQFLALGLIFNMIIMPISFIWFAVNIIMIAYIKTKKIEKVAFLIPSLYILNPVLHYFSVVLIMDIFHLNMDLFLSRILALIIPLIILFFTIKFLKNKK